jgi:hypothetical protein
MHVSYVCDTCAYVCVRVFMNVIRVPVYVVLANPKHM